MHQPGLCSRFFEFELGEVPRRFGLRSHLNPQTHAEAAGARFQARGRQLLSATSRCCSTRPSAHASPHDDAARVATLWLFAFGEVEKSLARACKC